MNVTLLASAKGHFLPDIAARCQLSNQQHPSALYFLFRACFQNKSEKHRQTMNDSSSSNELRRVSLQELSAIVLAAAGEVSKL